MERSAYLARIRAIGSEKRVRIIEALSRSPRSWSSLQAGLKMNPNTLSFNMAKLVDARLVKRTVRRTSGRPGKTTIYALTGAGRKAVIAFSGLKETAR